MNSGLRHIGENYKESDIDDYLIKMVSLPYYTLSVTMDKSQ